jgi:hypothetical protein
MPFILKGASAPVKLGVGRLMAARFYNAGPRDGQVVFAMRF